MSDHDPAALTDAELDRLLLEAHDDLLRHAREHTDPTTGLLAFMDDHSDDLVILELRALTQRTQKRMPEGVPELRDALLRADLPDPYLKHLTYLMTLTQALITVSDRYPNTARAAAQDLARELGSARAIAQALGLATDLNCAHAIAGDLARDPNSTRAVARTLALFDALNRALRHAIHSVRGFDDYARVVAEVIDIDLNGRLIWTSKSVFVLVRAVTSALEAESVDLSGVNVSHLRDLDLDVLAGAVWDRATTWPANLRELVERHSEEIGEGVFRVRRGTEREPQDSVLA
ncbi:hypothetical protein ETD83_24330 [Actinomadura soli]|uniref:Uncharacterized protein n=1 Tax=Actinomadura soli TaxID=2508997 RepID=A0A5C4J767_9ACTN|nr:hypothetical protein [Actinomadura soli]TMQ94150.1 hypothetical protein ETD83_24330 [Actinomadura soli]